MITIWPLVRGHSRRLKKKSMKKYIVSLALVFTFVGVAFADGDVKKAIDVLRAQCENDLRNIWWQEDVNSVREVIGRMDSIMENFDEEMVDILETHREELGKKDAIAIDVDNVSLREEVELSRALIQRFERVRVGKNDAKALARRLLNENAGEKNILDIAKRYEGQNAEFDAFIASLKVDAKNRRRAGEATTSARLRSAAGDIAQRVLGRRGADRSRSSGHLNGDVIDRAAGRIATRYVALYEASRKSHTARGTRSLFLESAKESRWPRDLSNRVLDVDALLLYNGLRKAARNHHIDVPHISALIVKAIRRAAK